MQIKLNIEKRNAILILSLIVFLAGILLVIGYGTNQPSTFGHTPSEISGLDSYIRQIVSEEISGLQTYNCSIIYSSMQGEIQSAVKFIHPKLDYTKIDVPSSCSIDIGCAIKQEVYDKKGLLVVRISDYFQEQATNKWFGTYKENPSGRIKNGDKTATDIIPRTPYSLYLLDDYYYKKGSKFFNETSSSQWTAIDKSSIYGMKVYICSYQPIDEE